MPNSLDTSQNNYDNNNPYSYNNVGSVNEFDFMEGVFSLPLAEMPPTDSTLATWSPVVNVRVHAPYRVHKVFFSAKKTGSPPILPSPESTGAMVFLEGNLLYHQPALDANMLSFIYEAKGAYTFIEDCRSNINDGFVLTCSPFTSAVQQSVNSNNSPIPIQYGAIAQAGYDARVGYTIGSQLDFSRPFQFPVCSFIPGAFFNSDLVNGVSASVLAPPPSNTSIQDPYQFNNDSVAEPGDYGLPGEYA